MSITIDPTPPTCASQGRDVFIRREYAGLDTSRLSENLIDRLRRGPDQPGAALDLATLCILRGDRAQAHALQTYALDTCRCFRVLGTGAAEPSLRVLALVTDGDFMANTPIEFMLRSETIALTLLYLRPGEPVPPKVPEHDVAITCVTYSRRNETILDALAAVADEWPRPLVNHPARIVGTSRESIARALGSIPDLTVARIARFGRDELLHDPGAIVEKGIGFPLIIRPVGSHAGNDLSKIDDARSLQEHLQGSEHLEFYASQYIDYRGDDGVFRKYRVAMIDGEPFICHMALSGNWMIHYLNAGMLESAEKREQEAVAMATFDAVFVPKHRAALQRVHNQVGLDYFVMDCSETPDGRLFVFEADNGMVVHDMDPPDLFPYKGPQMRKVFGAFHEAVRNWSR